MLAHDCGTQPEVVPFESRTMGNAKAVSKTRVGTMSGSKSTPHFESAILLRVSTA